MSVAARSTREAHTVWRVSKRFPKSARSWLTIRPETGRTPQLRVHLASVGLPIVGDPVYGRRGKGPVERNLAWPVLHAERLGFAHPRSGEWMAMQAPPPEEILALLAALERREGGAAC